MRIAIVSDIHGNRTAFEAVLRDMREMSPDVVLHGGDLADSGAGPADVVDHVRALGWRGVLGNTDEMLHHPESLIRFASQSPHLTGLFQVIEEMAAWTRSFLGDKRLEWLKALPLQHAKGIIALVHANPDDAWHAPSPEASDAELERVFSPLARRVAIYAHLHRPFIRITPTMTIANTGSVSLSYDGDPRASYLLLDEDVPTIRRIDYDIDLERKALTASGLPHAAWVAGMLAKARFEMP